MHIFLNGLGASAGAGLTYLYNVIPRLSAMPEVHTTLAVQPNLRDEFRGYAKVNTLAEAIPPSTAQRFWFEQSKLPKLIRQSGADLLISAGNFALRSSPIPQILLSGNSLYTSRDFTHDLLRRRSYGMWLDTKIRGLFAKKSVHWADCTIAPTEAFAAELRRWTGGNVAAIHHGFNCEIFFSDQGSLPEELKQKLASAADCLRLLFVSHYNYYRNFETLFRAIALLRAKLHGRRVRLFLTCRLNSDETPGTYKTDTAARLISELELQDEIVQLGAIPYHALHEIYHACDIYVTPAYTETFAHPLVEAMASGLPIIASDVSAHREICREALFFPPFSPQALADRIVQLATDSNLMHRLAAHGQQRAHDFSWDCHVEQLLQLGRSYAADDASFSRADVEASSPKRWLRPNSQ
ncbi:MAG TPA: glycosyltransferase family 1 protein [Terriglobales bacterium]